MLLKPVAQPFIFIYKLNSISQILDILHVKLRNDLLYHWNFKLAFAAMHFTLYVSQCV